MKDKILHRIKNWFLRFLQIQLVISLVLLVILPSWGLTLSLVSPIGNMLCTPFFMLFLMLSSLIFFLEILYIPNSFFIYLLEKITDFWFFLLPDMHNKSLIGFTKPPIWFIILIPIATFFILAHKRLHPTKKSILALLLLFTVSCAYLKIINGPVNFVKQISCNNGAVTFLHHNGATALIDPGYMGQRVSAESWVQFTLLPEIIKSSGKTQIDQLIIMQPGKLTFDAATQLCKSIAIKYIYLTVFDGPMKPSTLKSFFALKKEAQKRDILIYRMGRKQSNIKVNNKVNILITPLQKKLKYNKLRHPALCACITINKIDKKSVKIYSAKVDKNYLKNPK